MENINTQTEVIATYESSRTRRSLVEGNMLNNDSNNDEEYESNGFYVREKTTNKESDSTCLSNGLEDNPDVSVSDDSSVEKSSSNVEPIGGNSVAETSVNMDETEQTENTSKDTPEENLNLASLSNEESVVEKCDDEQTADSSNKNIKTSIINHRLNNSENIGNSTSSDCNDDQVISREEAHQDQTKDQNESEINATKPVEVEEVQKTNLDATPKTDSETETSSSKGSIDELDLILTDNKAPAQSPKAQNESEEKEKDGDESTRTLNNDNVHSTERDEELAKKKESQNNTTLSQGKNVDDEDRVVEENDEDTAKAEKANKDDETESNKTNEVVDVDATNESKLVDAVDLTLEEDATNTGFTKISSQKSPSKGSLLKGALVQAATEGSENDMEMYDDFDPSLLCPDISMDVDEAPVVTNENQTSTEGNISPLPYEAIFSTLVDEITGAEVQVDLTPAEMELRHQMYGSNNPVQKSKIHCTACNVHLGSAMIGANNRFVHPLLKVLICKNCYHFYTSGEFEKDEDGSELYCRWCGQGGQVLCCSSCEFVFCKRCIRNNFGAKKFKEIRNSDDWSCFRCHPEQLSSLRASCAEFMEYYRTELARAQSLSSKNPELMTTDYTICCTVTEKKEDAKASTTPKVRRKRKGEDEDPDYHPINIDEPPLKKPVPALGPGYTIITANGPRPILPKMTSIRPGVPSAVRPQVSQGQIYRVGNTTFRTKTPGGVLIQRVNPNQDVRNASPGYITIPPSSVVKTTGGIYFQNLTQLRTTNAPIRPQGAYTVVSGTNNGNPIFSTVRAPKANQVPVMKHEWFEKTVRAAARVNSNLSYTLTQLNRQQSQAANVEALATVHNKLQEVLSTSINSLIQIRKNLRTEFIAGIKTIKFPPKPAPAINKPPNTPIVLNDDDDVIFIHPTSTAASQAPALSTKVQGTLILSKKLIQKSNPFVNPKPSTSGLNTIKISGVTTTAAPPAPVKGGFLKVRSFTSLQSVPSECITIPDDPPRNKTTEVDPLSFTAEEDPLALPSENVSKSNHAKPVTSKLAKHKPKTTEPAVLPMKIDPSMVINVKRKQTPHVQKMMNAFVRLERSAVVDRLAEATKYGKKSAAVNKSFENGAS